MNFQLVEGNIDIVFTAQAIDRTVKLIHRVAAIAQFTYVEAQFMIQRAGAEGGKEDRRRWFLHHFRMFMRRLQQHLFHFIEIGSVGYAQADHHAGDGIGERPVDQPFSHEGLVWNNHLFAIEIGNGRRADTDLTDGA